MTLTVDELSVYELAHRMAEEDPYEAREPKDWSAGVKDQCRTLLTEIRNQHLESSLITSKPQGDDPPPREFYLSAHLDDFERCIAGTDYPVELLKFIRIYREDFRLWCKRSGQRLPKFWFAADFQWPKSADETPQEMIGIAEYLARTPETASRILRQTLESDDVQPKLAQRIEAMLRAIEIWQDDPPRPIARVAEHLKDEGYGSYVQPRTIKDWIGEIGREMHKRKAGRPKGS